ncbi:lipoprotein [Mycoplasma feriruminatoris]|uniref:Lipoprotein n=1 Tax=Mycoplasma feriruminatoris TaxID=1179777 RepID=A0AAX3TGD2_9MOLU|nr:lipoprotein [Mycoplasma feriruminatoris]WFQ93109.1 hypothetical protein MFERI14822_00903 [Mycoplasma feriruminatoris]
MKKLLTMLGSIALIATTSAAVVACGGKNPPQSSEKQPSENSNTPTDESKKDDKKGKDEKQTEPNFSDIEKEVFNFEPDENNIIPQAKIKKELAEKIKVSESHLQELKVDYEKNTISVLVTKYNKTLNLKFTKILDLGEIQAENKNNTSVVSQAKVKDALVKKLKTTPDKLQELKVNYDKNTGTVKGPKSSNPIEFKFTVKKAEK